MSELGEQLPVFRPPLDMTALFGEPAVGDTGELGVTVRYLTPHSKWSIHSEYQDNLFMLSLSRGGPTIWMSPADAEKIGVARQRLDRGGQPQRRRRRPRRSSPTGCPRAPCTCTTPRSGSSTCPLAETTGKRGGIHNSLTRLADQAHAT